MWLNAKQCSADMSALHCFAFNHISRYIMQREPEQHGLRR